MGKITNQCFLLLVMILFGWQVQGGERINQAQFENTFQNQLINSKSDNAVLNELTAFLHGVEYTNQETQNKELLIEDNVSLMACDSPTFDAYVNCDVENFIIMVTVEVTDLGSASTVVITDSANSPAQELTEPGSVTFGPYPYDEDITFTVSDEADESCNDSETVNSDNCPPIPCQMAEPFCSDEGLFFENNSENGSGQTPDDMPNLDYGCLSTQPNPSWYFLRIDDPGDMTLHITQNTAFDEDGNPTGTGLDVDFIAWGPFDSLNEACNNLTVDTQVADNAMGDGCSYSAAPEEDFGIVDAQAGDYYVLLLTNYSGSPGYIQVGQTAGEGSTDCSIVLENEVLGCYGEEVLLESEELSDIDTYIWYQYDQQTDEFVAYDDEFEDNLTVTESGTYKVEVFDAEGDTSEEIFDVVISPEPELDNLDEQMSLCGVDSITLDGTVFNPDDFGGIQYRWKDGNGDILGTSVMQEVTESGTYSLEVTTETLDSNGDESNEVCVTIIEIEITEADFSIDLGEDQAFCDVESFVIDAEIIGDENPEDADFVWTNEDGEVVGEEQSLEIFETGEYTVEANVGGCVNTDTIYIELNFAPEFDLGDDIMTCLLEEELIEVSLLDGGMQDSAVIEWNLNGEPIAEDGLTVNPGDYGYGVYSVTVYDGDPECSTTHEITVSEVEDFGVELTADNDLVADINYCEGDEATVSDYEITFTASAQGVESDDLNYTWYFNGEVMEDVTGNTFTAVYDNEGDFNDEVTVEVELGTCNASETLTTQINYGPFDHPCKISEGISPGNNDGFNDNLNLTFISDRSGISKFTVYNRYGTKVYDKADYVNEWHGQDNSGDDLVTGTYYFVLEMKNEDPVFGNVEKGWIYVNQKVN